jgi:hypothetical protein
MRHFSLEIRQSVYKALLCAQSAASLQQMMSKLEDTLPDNGRDQVHYITELAYAAAAHAWTAMIAFASNNLDVAQKAAQAAADAEETIMTISQELLPLGRHIPERKYILEQPPDEKGLYQLWDEFCRSLPSPYPVPESFDTGLWQTHNHTN